MLHVPLAHAVQTRSAFQKARKHTAIFGDDKTAIPAREHRLQACRQAESALMSGMPSSPASRENALRAPDAFG